MSAGTFKNAVDLSCFGRPQQMSSQYEVKIELIRDLSAIERLRQFWGEHKSHPNSDIDAYVSVLRAMSRTAEPLIFVLYRDGCPCSMLVGRLEAGELKLRLGYKDVATIAVRKAVFIHGGFIGERTPENSALLIKAVKDSLAKCGAQVAFFNSIPVACPLYLAATALQNRWLKDHLPMLQTHHKLSVPETQSELYQTLSSKTRKNLVWQSKKLVKTFSGDLRVHCFMRKDEFEQMLHDVEAIAQKTYQRGLGVGFEQSSVLRARLAQETEKGWLRVFVLYIRGTPRAFWAGKIYQDVFYSDFTGYDPELSKLSPGMFLITEVINSFCQSTEHRVKAIDFGLGDAQYKSVLGNSQWEEASFYLFAPTLRGFGFNLIRTPIAMLDKLAKQWLVKTSALQKIKRLWRAHLRFQTQE